MNQEKLILIVDDNRNNLKVLAKILKKESYQIALAKNGHKGLDLVKNKKPNLILLDIMMPEINGFEFCKMLKANHDTKDIPVIFISALKSTQKKLKAFEIGGVDYITKPFFQKEVLARVKIQLELQDKRQKLKNKSDELAKNLSIQKKLYKLSKDFSLYQKESLDEYLKKIVVDISQELSVGRVLIITFDLEKEVINNFVKAGIDKENVIRPSFSELKNGLSGWVIENKTIAFSPREETPDKRESSKVQKIRQESNCGDIIVVPLICEENVLGTLTVINSTTGRKLTENDRHILDSLSNQIATAIKEKRYKSRLKKTKKKLNQYYQEIKLKNIELEKLYNNLEAEFEKGRKIHQQFLPDDLPEVNEISYDTYFQPAAKLGGDFYDIIELKGQLLFYLSDVTGHGLDSSMLNIFLREKIKNYLLYEHISNKKLEASELIDYVVNKYREENFPDDYFICLLVGVLDVENMEVFFSNAGFQFPPKLISNTGDVSSVFCKGLPISSAFDRGLFMEFAGPSYQTTKIALEKGDTLFLMTDGLIEETVDGEIYGEKRLENVLVNNYKSSAKVINDKVKNDFRKFSGSTTGQDDLTFFTLKRGDKR